jgi:outer membrane protein
VSNRIIPALVAALALASAGEASAQAQKVGFVNSQRILAESPGVAAAQQTLQRELPNLRAPLDSMEQRLEAGQAQLQQQGATLSAQAREQRQTELQQLFAQYQQRTQAAQQQAQRREAELMQPIMRGINEAIEAERRAGAFSYVIDVAASNGMIVAFDPTLDITERVLVRVRGAAPAAPAPRP